MRYLTLYISGILQSWGDRSRFDIRETLPYPTKSGVTGMLLAASGDSGPQTELLERLAPNTFSVIVLKKNDEKDETPQLEDFHVVGNGYNKENPWESLFILRTKNEKIPVGGGAKLTYRFYLQDKYFGVIFQIQDDLAEKFANALQAPVYDLYLGRKCCAPNDILFQGCFDSFEEAKAKIQSIADDKALKMYSLIRDVNENDDLADSFLVNDVPLEFGIHKRYRSRRIIKDLL